MTDVSSLERSTASSPTTYTSTTRAPRSSLAGVLAGVVTAAGLAALVLIPGGGTTSTKSVIDFYDSSSKRAWAGALGVVLVAGCLLMMWFFTQIRARLADNQTTRTAHIFSMFGAASVAVGTCIMLGPSGVQNFTGQHFVGVPVAMAIAQSGLAVIILCGVYSLAVAIFLMSLQARRQRAVFPRWFATAGLVVAVLLIGSLVGSPAVLLPIWLVVAGVASRQPSRLTA